MRKETGTPCGAGWNRLLSGESAPAGTASAAAAARGGDFLVAARGWDWGWGEDLLGSISGDGWMGRGAAAEDQGT